MIREGQTGVAHDRAFPIDVTALLPGHWNAVRAIYAEGIATAEATFQTEPPSWESWDSDHLEVARLVALQGEIVVGWAALSPVSDRCAYRGVAEASVYVGAGHRGRGVGALLLRTLVEASEREGIWTLQAGIFPENTASVQLFGQFGFREVGVRRRLGQLHGRWRDVLLLERRSEVVGVDGRPGTSLTDRPRPGPPAG